MIVRYCGYHILHGNNVFDAELGTDTLQFVGIYGVLRDTSHLQTAERRSDTACSLGVTVVWCVSPHYPMQRHYSTSPYLRWFLTKSNPLLTFLHIFYFTSP